MSNQVAVVTGANKGIGLGIVRALCKQGIEQVILTSLKEEWGIQAVQDLQSEGLNAVWEQLDICSEESVNKFADVVRSKYGGIDVLCNNAGISYHMASTAPLIEKAEVTNNTNLLGTIRVTEALLPLMKPGGRICQVASTLGLLSRSFADSTNPVRQRLTAPSLTVEDVLLTHQEYLTAVRAGDYTVFKQEVQDNAYAFSKCMLIAYTLARSRAGLPNDVILNACCPGFVATDMTADLPPAMLEHALTIDQGAKTPTMLCNLPPSAGSGKFYRELAEADWILQTALTL